MYSCIRRSWIEIRGPFYPRRLHPASPLGTWCTDQHFPRMRRNWSRNKIRRRIALRSDSGRFCCSICDMSKVNVCLILKWLKELNVFTRIVISVILETFFIALSDLRQAYSLVIQQPSLRCKLRASVTDFLVSRAVMIWLQLTAPFQIIVLIRFSSAIPCFALAPPLFTPSPFVGLLMIDLIYERPIGDVVSKGACVVWQRVKYSVHHVECESICHWQTSRSPSWQRVVH